MSDQEPREEDKPEGAIDPEDLVQPDETTAAVMPEVETVPEPKREGDRPLSEIAQEVFRGEWGVGQEKRQKLQEAGYNPREVEEEVIRLRNE